MSRKKMTEAEKEEKTLQLEKDHTKRQLRDLRETVINDPTISYKVGQKIQYGNHENSVVVEVLDEGKIIGVKSDTIKIVYVAWHEITPFQEEVPDSLINNDDIHLSYSQTLLTSLLSRFYHFRTEMNPEYQRENVWTEEQEIALIDSIFNNVDIGKFTYIHNSYTTECLYEILDGKQRLTAIIRFFEGRFQYKGKYYYQLSHKDRRHFKDYMVSVGDIKDWGEVDVDMEKNPPLNPGKKGKGREWLHYLP